MSEKTFKIVGNDISDGYHTFDELYEHRFLLFLAFASLCYETSFMPSPYRVLEHYPGWDLYVAYVNEKQISYHVPVKYRPLCTWIEDVPSEDHIWDGHTSQDVIERLTKWLEG